MVLIPSGVSYTKFDRNALTPRAGLVLTVTNKGIGVKGPFEGVMVLERVVPDPTNRSVDVSTRAPDGEHCVDSNRRPHQNARESCARGSVYEKCASSEVVQQHRGDQPAPGAARPIIARQPAGAA
jgi:hypothetical protein